MPIISSTDITTYETHGSRFHSYVAPSRGSDQLCAWRLEVPPGLEGVRTDQIAKRSCSFSTATCA